MKAFLARNYQKFHVVGLILLFLLLPAISFAQSSHERIAFAGYRNGQWDIYSIKPDGFDLRQLTFDVAEDTDPAYSPDGTKLAFASWRNSNWDVYVLNLVSGEQRQLSSSPHYDGAPSWSPEGTTIAYESYQNGDLDIWLVAAEGNEAAINMTAASVAGDFAPAWSPDGASIAFSSWRGESKDLFLLDVASGDVISVTNSPMAEEGPVWHPTGDKLAFVQDNLGEREIFSLNVNNPPVKGGPVEQITWLGRTDGPVWSPDGEALAGVFHSWDGQILTVQTVAAQHQLPHELSEVVNLQGRLTWHAQATNFGEVISTLAGDNTSALYEESVSFNAEAGASPYALIYQNDLSTGTPRLADTVDDSFRAWRQRLRGEVGYDFLSQLSDATRDIGAYSETSQYASWHKSGRAIDTLFDYHIEGQLAHELVKEVYSGEIYWRVYLRCVDQSGRCGRPLTKNSWNYSARARTTIAPKQGGIEKPNLSGYYVDLSALAREYGWERISSYEDVDYSWTWHFLAFEYWHYQKRLNHDSASEYGAANWYQAMQHIYSPQTLNRFFTWEKMSALGEDPHLIALKGVPLPPQAKPWWALVRP